MMEPATRPKVAAAMETTLPPAAPAASSSGPYAAAVPGPPTRAMEPQPMPRRGSLPNRAMMPPPRKFCTGIMATATSRQRTTALPPFRRAGMPDGEAHSGEEHDHKDALKGVVKGNGGSSRGIEDAVHDGEAQAAHQGRGNTVAVQEADLAGDHASQPEQECAQRNSVVHIQTDLKHSCTVLSLCYFALQSFSGHRPPTQSNGFCKSKNTAF